MSEQKHYVTLTIESGELHRGFVCESPPDAVCRRRPQDWGDRESWSADEATEPGFECWAERWIQDVGIEDAIHGLDDELARVPVKISYSEGVEITPVSEQFEQDDREALTDEDIAAIEERWTATMVDLQYGRAADDDMTAEQRRGYMADTVREGDGELWCVWSEAEDGPRIHAFTGDGPTSRVNAVAFASGRRDVESLIAEVRRLRRRSPAPEQPGVERQIQYSDGEWSREVEVTPAPKQVGTVTELDALPLWSVVMGRLAGGGTQVAARGVGHWLVGGHRSFYTSDGVEYVMGLPLTVLWVPDTEGSAE